MKVVSVSNISFAKSLNIWHNKPQIPFRYGENPTNLNLMPRNYYLSFGKVQINSERQSENYISKLGQKLKEYGYPVTKEYLAKAHNILSSASANAVQKDTMEEYFKKQMEYLSNPIDFEEFKELVRKNNRKIDLSKIFYDRQYAFNKTISNFMFWHSELVDRLKDFTPEKYEQISEGNREIILKKFRRFELFGSSSNALLQYTGVHSSKLFNSVKNNLDEMYGGKEKKCKDKIAVVLIGRSLASFETMFKLSGIQAKAVPFSMRNTPINIEKYLDQSGLNEFLKANEDKKIVFTDYTDSGKSLEAFKNTLLLGNINTDNMDFKSFNQDLLDKKLRDEYKYFFKSGEFKYFCHIIKTKELDEYTDEKYFDVNSHIKDIEKEVEVPLLPKLFQFLLVNSYKTFGNRFI